MHRPTLPARAPMAACLLALLVAAPVVASHVAPELVDDAESCLPLTEGTVELVVMLPDDVGTIAEGDFEVDVTLDGDVTDGSVSFSGASLPIEAAFVSGVDSGNLYRYAEPVTEDDGLTAPDGSPIRSVSFCYVSGEGDADAGDPSGGAAGSGDGDGEGGSEASPPPTDMAPSGSGGPAGMVLIVLGAISLAGAVLAAASARRRAGASGTSGGPGASGTSRPAA